MPRVLPPRVEAVSTVMLGAPLMFPMVVPAATVAGAVGILAIGAYQSLAGAPVLRKSPADWPWALLLLQAVVATAISPFPLVSITRLACIVFGSILLRAMLTAVRTHRDIEVMTWLYAIGGGLVGVGGLFGTQWPGFADLNRKLSVLGPLASRFPQRLAGIPGAEAGFNANAMGGATLFFIPVLAALAIRAASERSSLQAIVALGALLPLAAVVVLTQSRTAWLALAVVAAVMLLSIVRSKAVTAAMAGAAAIAIAASGAVPAALGSRSVTPPGALIRMDTRPQLWARAVQMIRKAPLTGIGLDAFRITGREVAPPFDATDKSDVHVHNVFLQTALDFGLPGLVVFVALLLTMGFMWRAVDRVGASGDRLVALGVFGGLLGVTVFGLYDAIMIGTKLSLCFWWSLGLLETLHQRVAFSGAYDDRSSST